MQDLALSECSKALLFQSTDEKNRHLTASQLRDWSLSTVEPDAWDQLLAEFDDSSFEQSAAFATERWGRHRTVCVKIERSGTIVGGACVAVLGLPGIRRGIAYVKYGPVWRQSGQGINYDTYRSALSLLVQKFGVEQGHALVVVPRPYPEIQTREYEVLHEMGFESGRPTLDPNRYLVDLSLDTDEQFKSLGQKWRYNLKRARSNNLEITWSDDQESVSKFIDLYSEMISRKNFDSTDPMGALRGMMTNLPHALKPKIVLAYHSGRPIAGAAVVICGDVAYYMFGASRDEALPLRAGYGVQWNIIENLKQQGARWYDLGGECGEGGLRQFKNGLVGKRGVIVATRGERQYCSGVGSKIARTLVIGASEARRVLREGLGSVRGK